MPEQKGAGNKNETRHLPYICLTFEARLNAVQMENLTLRFGSRQIPTVSDDFYRGFKSDRLPHVNILRLIDQSKAC